MSEIKEPAVALIELRSIARGIKTADEMVKKAPIRLMEARTVCPGKYIIVVTGEVGSVEEAYKAGMETGKEMVVDDLFLPNADGQLIPAMEACVEVDKIVSLGILETFSVASVIRSADSAAKTAEVTLIELRMANGLGGKSFFTMTGELNEVEAAMEAGVSLIEEEGALLCNEIIPNPHNDINLKLL